MQKGEIATPKRPQSPLTMLVYTFYEQILPVRSYTVVSYVMAVFTLTKTDVRPSHLPARSRLLTQYTDTR